MSTLDTLCTAIRDAYTELSLPYVNVPFGTKLASKRMLLEYWKIHWRRHTVEQTFVKQLGSDIGQMPARSLQGCRDFGNDVREQVVWFNVSGSDGNHLRHNALLLLSIDRLGGEVCLIEQPESGVLEPESVHLHVECLVVLVTAQYFLFLQKRPPSVVVHFWFPRLAREDQKI